MKRAPPPPRNACRARPGRSLISIKVMRHQKLSPLARLFLRITTRGSRQTWATILVPLLLQLHLLR